MIRAETRRQAERQKCCGEKVLPMLIANGYSLAAMKKIVIIVLVILALAGFGFYKLANSLGRAGEAGDAAVGTFHGHYNGNQVDLITSGAAPDFRSSVSPEQFSGLVRLLREKLGDWKSGERTGINMRTVNGNETLELTYDATFTKGTGTEEFVFDYNGTAPLLLGYNVKSPALIEIPPDKGDKGDKAEDEPAAPANP